MEEKKLTELVERLDQIFNIGMKKMHSQLEKELHPLTGPQFFILKLLSVKGKVTVTELAEKFNVKPSSITNMIDRLEKMEFTHRKRDAEDRRVVYIKITDEGKEMIQKKEAERLERMKKVLNQLEPGELETLITIHEKILLLGE